MNRTSRVGRSRFRQSRDRSLDRPRLAEYGGDDITESGADLIAHSLQTDLRNQETDVSAGDGPCGGGGKDARRGGGSKAGGDAGRAGFRHELTGGGKRRGMPRLEDLHLTHDPVGESGRGRKVGEGIQGDHELAGFLELGLTGRATSDVGPKGRHAKAFLTIEEQFEFVRS